MSFELHCLICRSAPVHLVEGIRTEDSILFYHVIAIKAMCKEELGFSKSLSDMLVIASHLQLIWPSSKSVGLWSCRLGFDSESDQFNDFKIGIHSLLA